MKIGAGNAEENMILEMPNDNYRVSERIFDPNYEVEDETRRRVNTFYRNLATRDFGKDLDALFDED